MTLRALLFGFAVVVKCGPWTHEIPYFTDLEADQSFDIFETNMTFAQIFGLEKPHLYPQAIAPNSIVKPVNERVPSTPRCVSVTPVPVTRAKNGFETVIEKFRRDQNCEHLPSSSTTTSQKKVRAKTTPDRGDAKGDNRFAAREDTDEEDEKSLFAEEKPEKIKNPKKSKKKTGEQTARCRGSSRDRFRKFIIRTLRKTHNQIIDKCRLLSSLKLQLVPSLATCIDSIVQSAKILCEKATGVEALFSNGPMHSTFPIDKKFIDRLAAHHGILNTGNKSRGNSTHLFVHLTGQEPLRNGCFYPASAITFLSLKVYLALAQAVYKECHGIAIPVVDKELYSIKPEEESSMAGFAIKTTISDNKFMSLKPTAVTGEKNADRLPDHSNDSKDDDDSENEDDDSDSDDEEDEDDDDSDDEGDDDDSDSDEEEDEDDDDSNENDDDYYSNDDDDDSNDDDDDSNDEDDWVSVEDAVQVKEEKLKKEPTILHQRPKSDSFHKRAFAILKTIHNDIIEKCKFAFSLKIGKDPTFPICINNIAKVAKKLCAKAKNMDKLLTNGPLHSKFPIDSRFINSLNERLRDYLGAPANRPNKRSNNLIELLTGQSFVLRKDIQASAITILSLKVYLALAQAVYEKCHTIKFSKPMSDLYPINHDDESKLAGFTAVAVTKSDSPTDVDQDGIDGKDKTVQASKKKRKHSKVALSDSDEHELEPPKKKTKKSAPSNGLKSKEH